MSEEKVGKIEDKGLDGGMKKNGESWKSVWFRLDGKKMSSFNNVEWFDEFKIGDEVFYAISEKELDSGIKVYNLLSMKVMVSTEDIQPDEPIKKFYDKQKADIEKDRDFKVPEEMVSLVDGLTTIVATCNIMLEIIEKRVKDETQNMEL